VATGVAAGAAIVLAAASAHAAVTPGWRFVAVYPQVTSMQSVSATSAVNAWATGLTFTSGPCYPCSLASHWNGEKWETLTPHLGGDYGLGAAVAAIPGGRAWVFLATWDGDSGLNDVAGAEWLGRSWSAVHDFGSLLPSGFIASGQDDVWAFGSDPAPYGVHFNGTTWTQLPMPVNQAAWSGTPAAGDWVLGTVVGQPAKVELVHWAQGAWQNAILPQAIAVPAGDQMFPGLLAANTTADLWVTVTVGPAKGHGTVRTHLLHWNGKAWSQVAIPTLVNQNGIGGLASDGHGGAWAAISKLGMYHYSDGRWTHVPAPGSPNGSMELIPGTQSILAPARATTGGAVLKYGP